jgi:glycosyltransferase involved in cell wall biosynthesis
MNKNFRFAIVLSHPIQYWCPQFASFSKIPGIEIKLFFASAMGYKKYVDKNFGQEVIWNNLRLDEFNHVFLNGDEVLPANKELDAPTLERELEAFEPDAVLNFGYFQKIQKRLYDWATSNKIPIVYMSDAENRQQRQWWKKVLKYIYLSWRFKKVSYFFTIGDENENYYKNYGVNPDKFIRMHHPIDIECYKVAYEKKDVLGRQIREQYQIPQEDFVISVVGKLVEWKSQEHLVDLLIDLEKKGKKAHLFILGSGKMLDYLKQKAQTLKVNKVHFSGFVDPLQLPEFYAASNVYIHPARIEPHSLAISEAVYMGCPVIVSDKCGSYGPDDDVQEGKNGYVYQFGDMQQLSKQVIQLMEDKGKQATFGLYSHKIAKKFQQRSHSECIKELSRKILQ